MKAFTTMFGGSVKPDFPKKINAPCVSKEHYLKSRRDVLVETSITRALFFIL